MRTGEIVKIKDSAGNKLRARVVKVERQTEAVDATADAFFGNPAVVVRYVVPGRTTTTVTLELISTKVKAPKKRKLKLGDEGTCTYVEPFQDVPVSCGQPATAQYDPYAQEIDDEDIIVMLCEDHLQERRDDI